MLIFEQIKTLCQECYFTIPCHFMKISLRSVHIVAKQINIYKEIQLNPLPFNYIHKM